FNCGFEKLRNFYAARLEWALNHARLVIGVMVTVVVLSLVLVTPFLGEDFFPKIDAGQFRLHVSAPVGTRIEDTQQVFYQIENVIRSVIPKDQIDGYIKKWYVDIGDHVQQGQVRADIEAPQIDADLRMAQAQLKLAEANLKLAQTNSARSQELFQNHVNSQQELDTVLATEQVQQATRDNAAAALTSAQDMKAFEQILAPFAGTITARYIDVGSLVASGSARTVQKLFDLAQSDPVRVFVNVPQADVSSVKS